MLNLQQTTTGLDLARSLSGEEGTFLCRNGAQNYLVVAQSGHSIKSGPTPLGPPVAGLLQAGSVNGEPWIITKISNIDIAGDLNRQ
jgi:hypothetical protein